MVLINAMIKPKNTPIIVAKKVIIRVWLSDSYAVSNDVKSFAFDISTKAK